MQVSTTIKRPQEIENLRNMDRKTEVLHRLANTLPRQLCNEAKLEKCRAMKDIRTCGRNVQYGLASCGHASLCGECIQRCELCPVCRSPVAKDADSRVLRLYDACTDVGLLLPVREDETFLRDVPYLSVDVRRLFKFFDIAMEQGLLSLICHYVTDVCLDETAVSSDPTVSVLLDGAVVKEWCKKTFQVSKKVLRDTYKLGKVELSRELRLEVLEKTSYKLKSIATVLELLDSPWVEPCPEPLLDLKYLLEAVRRTSQHLEAMTWAARQRFLEASSSPAQRFPDFSKWRSAVRQRKQSSQERTWPEYSQGTFNFLGSKPTPSPLFIDEAMAQLREGISSFTPEKKSGAGSEDLYDLGPLREARGVAEASVSGKPREIFLFEAPVGSYPPESVRAAIDGVFLDGSSDALLAKQAIFLYYLFDRMWSTDSSKWQLVVEDFVNTFSIPRNYMWESLVFFLLDDDSPHALQEACKKIPQITSSSVHPRVPRVLLERGQPMAALELLRSSGKDESSGASTSLAEAVTAVRVWLECGLLTEAFLYQRKHWERVKAESEGGDEGSAASGVSKSVVGVAWRAHAEFLVAEICWQCIRRGWVDRMLLFPWEEEEEKTIKGCLWARAKQVPAGAAGSFLVTYFLQRCRYIEAEAVHLQLCKLENMCEDETRLDIIQRLQTQRDGLVSVGVSLLPEHERDSMRRQLKAVEDSNNDKEKAMETDVLTASASRLSPISKLTAPALKSNGLQNSDLALKSSMKNDPAIFEFADVKSPGNGLSFGSTSILKSNSSAYVSPPTSRKMIEGDSQDGWNLESNGLDSIAEDLRPKLRRSLRNAAKKPAVPSFAGTESEDPGKGNQSTGASILSKDFKPQTTESPKPASRFSFPVFEHAPYTETSFSPAPISTFADRTAIPGEGNSGFFQNIGKSTSKVSQSDEFRLDQFSGRVGSQIKRDGNAGFSSEDLFTPNTQKRTGFEGTPTSFSHGGSQGLWAFNHASTPGTSYSPNFLSRLKEAGDSPVFVNFGSNDTGVQQKSRPSTRSSQNWHSNEVANARVSSLGLPELTGSRHKRRLRPFPRSSPHLGDL